MLQLAFKERIKQVNEQFFVLLACKCFLEDQIGRNFYITPMPKKYFNVAGPCNSSDHYMLDPFRGIDKNSDDYLYTRDLLVFFGC